MEGGIDLDERIETQVNNESQGPGGEEEQEEGNKFQKAIGAWRSMQTLDTYCRRRGLTMRQTLTSPHSSPSSTP